MKMKVSTYIKKTILTIIHKLCSQILRFAVKPSWLDHSPTAWHSVARFYILASTLLFCYPVLSPYNFPTTFGYLCVAKDMEKQYITINDTKFYILSQGKAVAFMRQIPILRTCVDLFGRYVYACFDLFYKLKYKIYVYIHWRSKVKYLGTVKRKLSIHNEASGFYASFICCKIIFLGLS